MESIIKKLGKASITVEKDYHSSEKEYNKLTIVEEQGAFKTYLSRKPVPIGTELTNREYWIPFSGVLESITFDYLKFKRDYASGNALDDNSIITRHILDRNIERIKIALKAISEEEIDDNAIIERTIKDRNVTSNKIAKENILTEHFAKKSVITAILADYVITAIKLADNSVTTRTIVNENITQEKLSIDIQSLISNLSKTATFSGIATPTTNPGIPTAKTFYIANDKGIYNYFNNIEILDDEVAILYFDTTWHKKTTEIASKKILTNLKEKVDSLALGTFYGFYPDSSSLPIDITTSGYAYIGLDTPYKIWNFNGESWSDSGTVIDMNDADEEDITRNIDGKLQFKDKEYGDGMGYVILRKNKSFAEQITKENTIYEIRYDFDLNSEEIIIPDGCILKFNGGRLLNGIIKGNKLDTNEVYYPEQFGANGIDDTVAIQNCVTLAKYVNMSGVYKVHSDNRLSLIEECAISVPSNTNIELNGTIELITDNKSHSIVFYILNQKNIIIHGSGIIIGDRDSNTLSSGEWGYGIGIFGSENIQVSGLTLHSFFGDGIFVGTYYDKGLSKYIHPTNIKLEDLEIFKNRRQGISVQDGSSIYIYNSVIYDIEGTAPHGCIDIEAVANNGRLIENVIIKGCILNNKGNNALYVTGSENVLISSCDVYGHIYIRDLAYCDNEGIPRIKLCSVKMQDVHSKDILGCSIDIKLDHCEFGDLYLDGQSPDDNLHRDSFILEANYCTFAKIYDNTYTYNGTLNFYNCKIIADDCNNSGFITLQKRANNKINKLNLFNCYLRAGNFYKQTGMINAVSYSCDSCTFEYDRQWEIYGTYYNCIFKYSRADNTDCFVVNRAKGITKLYNCILWNTSNTDIYSFRANTINSRIDAYNVKTINCNNTIFKSLGVVNVYNLINMSESELVSKYKIRGRSSERPFPDYKGFCYYDTDFNMPVWSTEGKKPSSTISVESVSGTEEQTTSFIVKTYDSKEHIISINITNNMTKDDLLLAIYNSIIASSSLMTSTYKPIVSLLESSVVISGQDNTSGNISIESLPSISGISWSVNNVEGIANKWLDAFGNNIDAKKFGIFSDKPDISTGIKVGFSYFCTDRKTTEGNSNGILIYYKGNGVWVDALGRVVS